MFEEAISGLIAGDFSRLEPLFDQSPDGTRPPPILSWLVEGRFEDHPDALNEALANACFLGKLEVMRALLEIGVNPLDGKGTGLDGFHWAANRGEVEAVRLLISAGTPMESRSHYGATVLGTAVWSAVNEPRPGQVEVIDLLLEAGARLEGAHLDELGFPTDNEELNLVLRRHGVA